MTTNIPPSPTDPNAAMYHFTHGPGLHDLQPQSEGFWTLAGHDEELFRLGFVHHPPGATVPQIHYQVFRPIKTLNDLETHAENLVYEYDGEFDSVPQDDEGFASPDAPRDNAVHLSQPRSVDEDFTSPLESPGSAMDQDQNFLQPGFNVEPSALVQLSPSAMSQMMPGHNAPILSPVVDQHPPQASQVIDDSSWAFAPPALPAQDDGMVAGVPMVNAGVQDMPQQQMVVPQMWQTQAWADLPDANNQNNGDDQMIPPNF
ncbi:hypothetical protein EDB80DRAFT_701317 [Ilyonectria destructans]|nr:hypothetical protein EDB80DRAFT_701317 [Ilyonectria destructans]